MEKSFSSKIGVLLAAAGSAVGLGSRIMGSVLLITF